jgi:hypothetical protein
MQKKLTLSIANPCHEDWDKMTDDAKGKFCGSCEKQVIDFTRMSESQLVAFFKKPGGLVCGRFRADQLDQQMNIPKKRIPWIRYFFTISLPAFLFSMKAGAQIKGEIADTVFVPKYTKNLMPGKVAKAPEQIAVTGNVIDADGNPVPFATVMVKHSKIGVAADENGFFSFKANLQYPITLEASAAGFESAETEKKSGESISITLKQTATLGEVVINTNSVKNNHIMLGGISAGITHCDLTWTEKEINEKEASGVTNAREGFIVYPNPVRRGNSFTVDPKRMQKGEYKVNIADLSGKLILSREVIVRDGSAYSFNLSDFAGGTYLISFINKNTGGIISQKLILK